MSLTGPHVITGRRKLLKATLVGISGAFQRVQYQGAGAASLLLSATAQARRLFSAAGSAALTFSASAGTEPVSKAAGAEPGRLKRSECSLIEQPWRRRSARRRRRGRGWNAPR